MTDELTISAKKRGLGRGLEALFGDEESGFSPPLPEKGAAATDRTDGPQRRTLGVDQLEPCSYQPRKYFDEDKLKELAASIAAHGILQPLLVRPKHAFPDIYEIVAGERRWRAALHAGLHEVPVIIRKLDDRQTLEIALIENLQRDDLNPVEEAKGYRNLIEEFGYSHEKAGAMLGKSRSHITNMLRILTLPSPVLRMVESGGLSAGHARTLVNAPDPEKAAREIAEKGLSVRDAERLAGSGSAEARNGGKKESGWKDVDTLALEQEISAALGLKISIDMKGDGKGGRAGTLKVSFTTLDQLDDVLHRLSHYPGNRQDG